MTRLAAWILLGTLVAGPLPAVAQRRGFDNGLHQSVERNGYNDRYDRGRYRHDDRNDDRNRGGIGPGKGALIGAAGGAVLGALFGGGLKGAIIGGGVGAGGGAIVGKVNQDNRQRDYRDSYYRR